MRKIYMVLYERKAIFMDDLKRIFGNRIGNRLLRMGISTIDELERYCQETPFKEFHGSCVWRGIGVTGYKQIEEFLCEEES